MTGSTRESPEPDAYARDPKGRRAETYTKDRALKESELLSCVIDNAPIGTAVVTMNGRWVRINRTLCEIAGYTERELMARSYEEITHPEDLDSERALLRQLRAREIRTYSIEKRLLHKTGREVWVKVWASLLLDDEDQEPLHFIAQIENIATGKEIEQALRQSEARLHAIVENAPVGISLSSLQGRYVLLNSSAGAVLGGTPGELIGQPVGASVSSERVAAVRAENEQMLRGGEPVDVELEIPQDDGTMHVYHFVRYPVRDPDGAIIGFGAFLIDITERKLAEERLREREHQLAEAQSLAHVGSWEWDPSRPRVQWSEEMRHIFGQAANFNPTYAEFLTLVHPEDREMVAVNVDTTRAAGSSEIEYRIVRPGGEVRDVHGRRYARTDGEGHVTLFGTTQDITERKRAERELRRTREHAETIISAMSEGYLLTIENHITAVNQALCDLTGFSRDELIGTAPPFPFWAPEHLEENTELRERMLADGGGTFDVVVMHKDGSRLQTELTVRPAHTSEGTLLGFVGTLRDISARKRYEAELERLATRDSLTGLANHRVFHERLHEEVTRAKRHRRPLSVALFDLDHFKEVNDRYGHLVGDSVLREVAGRLTGLVREGELLARVGGEEFAWIMPDAEGTGSFSAVERARHAIRADPIDTVGWVTLSAGVCDLTQADDREELYRRADQALYWAKQQGRDRTFLYSARTERELEAHREHERDLSSSDGGRRRALKELATAGDEKHPAFTHHADRVAEIARSLAAKAGWGRADADALNEAALVHDVGMVAIPDSIVNKSESLTKLEREQIRAHPAVSAEILKSSLTREQVSWVRHHHERWDGTGYPDHLKGPSIPNGAQLIAVADAYDAMTHQRPNRGALTHERALREIHAHAGTQFDPEAVQLLEQALSQASPNRA